MAEHVTKRVPSVERLRLVSSGTEAAMSAIRVARAATQRDKIVKFVGCYHGHADYLLVQAGSGVATLGLPDSPGVPASFTEHTLALPFNDLGAVERAFGEYPDQIAAVALEAVTGNMGVMAPKPGYLEGLRELTTKHGAMLMFDEVMTGFRVHEAGAQGLFGIEPDITAFGKVIGGGFPMAGFGGKAAAMDLLAPVGPVYQAGTLSGNPAAVAAGLTTLELLDAEAYAHLETLGAALQAGLEEALSSSKQSGRVQRIGSMITLYFNDGSPLHDFDDAKAADHQKFAKFFHGMLDRGFHLPPSGYESWFLSTAHSKADIDATVAAAAEVMNTL
jgi:glutamate-1-semialdehyde 2,1-aminomutase